MDSILFLIKSFPCLFVNFVLDFVVFECAQRIWVQLFSYRIEIGSESSISIWYEVPPHLNDTSRIAWATHLYIPNLYEKKTETEQKYKA